MALRSGRLAKQRAAVCGTTGLGRLGARSTYLPTSNAEPFTIEDSIGPEIGLDLLTLLAISVVDASGFQTALTDQGAALKAGSQDLRLRAPRASAACRAHEPWLPIRRMDKQTEQTLRRTLKWFINPILEVAPRVETMDPREYTTEMTAIEATMRQRLDTQQIDPEASFREFAQLLANPVIQNEMRETIRKTGATLKKEASADRRYSLLLNLMRAADERTPLGAMHAIQGFDIAMHMRRVCEPADLLSEAHRTSGEIRARAVVRLIRETAEMLYDPFLRVGWRLTEIARDKPSECRAKFGNLVQQLHARLGPSASLVDEDAGHYRNAASHAQWFYRPGRDAILMWDKRDDGTEVWREEIPVDDLLTSAKGMYSIAGPTFFNVVSLYLTRLVSGTGMLDLIFAHFPDLASGDDARRIAADKAIEEGMAAIFEGTAERAVGRHRTAGAADAS